MRRSSVSRFSTTPRKPTAGKPFRSAPGGALRHRRRRPGRPRHLRRARRSARCGNRRFVGRAGRLHFGIPQREGQDVPRLDHDRVRGPEEHEEFLGGNRLAPVRAPTRASLPRCRRRPRRAPLSERSTDRRSGSPTSRSRACARARSSPRPSGAAGRTRVIVDARGPPLAAAAPRNAFATVGQRRKLNLASSFARSYLAGWTPPRRARSRICSARFRPRGSRAAIRCS